MKIANTLSGLIEHPHVQAIMDRSAVIDNVIDDVLRWRRQGFYHRHPSPTFNSSGEFRGTDLDLLTFMTALEERRATINVRDYEEQRPITYHFSQELTSENNRYGQIIALNGNEDVFAFSARIIDETVFNTDTQKYGAPRNFLLTTLEGEVDERVKTWDLTRIAEDNEFLKARRIISGDTDTIKFKYAVHPNSWQSIYGQPYAIAKMSEPRLQEEASYYRLQDKLLLKAGISLIGKPVEITKRERGIKKRVETLEARMDFPMHGEYPKVSADPEGRTYAHHRANILSHHLLSRLRYATRSAELSYLKWGKNGNNKPSWPVPEWERDYKTSHKSRIKWNRMDFGNGISLRCRYKTTLQDVNKLFAE